MKKLYSIGELINENIMLKKKIDKIKEESNRNLMNILIMIKPYLIRSPIDIDKIIQGLIQELSK